MLKPKSKPYRNGASTATTSSSSSSAFRSDYEYFQLYDPDDSDLESEVDPDVRSLLASHVASLGLGAPGGRRRRGNSRCCDGLGNSRLTKHQVAVVSCLVVVLVLVVILAVVFGVSDSPSPLSSSSVHPIPPGSLTTTRPRPQDPLTEPPPSRSPLGNFSTAAIAVDGEQCADIALDVFKRNGSAVDAAIAALFCDGLVNSHSMGIGGGFLMTVYRRADRSAAALDARETAPAASTQDMYHGDPDASSLGARAGAVPGEVRGYWEAKQRFGNPEVEWSSLVQPSIVMCEQGIPVSAHAERAMRKRKELIFKDPGMRSVFINPATNDTWRAGDTYRRPQLARTLRAIAMDGPEAFYGGRIAEGLARDVREAGGIITEDDLRSYKAEWVDAVSATVGPHVLHSVPPPGSGAILAYILNILQHYDVGPGDDQPVLYHRIVEAFKWAYAVRTRLGDPADPEITEEVNELVKNMTSTSWGWDAFRKINDSFTVNNASYYGADFYTPDDHGTAHISILAPNGDAVAVTSTVNQYYGSCFLSPSTGVILNDEMDDFSYPGIVNEFGVPPSRHNFVKPGKRPLSSMSPSVFVDHDGEARLVVGAVGGTKITTAVALTAIRNLWVREDIKAAVDDRRLHHQLAPMRVDYEEGLTRDITTFLSSRGHVLHQYEPGSSEVFAVAKEEGDGRVYATYDFRKGGSVAGV